MDLYGIRRIIDVMSSEYIRSCVAFIIRHSETKIQLRILLTMSPQRYENDGDVDTRRLSEPLRFYFSGRTMRNRLFKASMGETLGLWDSSDVASSGVPSKEIIELYRRCVTKFGTYASC